MSHINFDQKKIQSKWSPVLERLGIQDETKKEWLSEYCEIHTLVKSGVINENGIAYANIQNVAGMGAYVAPGIAAPGVQGTAGSDLATTFLGTALKVAAQTIGLDLVNSKPSPGPVLDLPFLDFKYDDVVADGDEKPQAFMLNCTNLTAIKAFLNTAITDAGIIKTQGGLSGRMFFHFSTSTGNDFGSTYTTTTEPTGSKVGWLEFLGFSRINGLPMFRAYRQANTASSGAWTFDATKNTFAATATIVDSMTAGKLEDPATGDFSTSGSVTFGTITSADISLISAFEDHIPGYTTEWTKAAVTRSVDDAMYPGIIAPSYSVKRIVVGTTEITTALRRTEVEDIKAQTGIDLLQKSEAVLINELAQTISKEIVAKVAYMGETNRASAPAGPAGSTISGVTIFDFDVDYYMASANVPGGETSHAVARKLLTRIDNASHFIATEGRVGPAEYMVTNGNLAAAIKNIAGYTIAPVQAKINGRGQLYPVGTVGDILIYVDPNMSYSDNRIFLGRKNKVDEPGILFVPYLMAQSVTIISEATWAPRMLLRSRYAVAEVGWYPHKQFMAIHVLDTDGILA